MSETSGSKPSDPCNATQPGATARNAVQPNSSFGKTKPNPPGRVAARDTIARAVGSSVSEWSNFFVPQVAPPCNAVQPDATPRNRVQPISRFAKTNPPRFPASPTPGQSGGAQSSSGAAPGRSPFVPLTPRQRAAARLLALGRTIPQTAAELKVARTTIWRWQTVPGFRAELDHLHLWLAGARIGTR